MSRYLDPASAGAVRRSVCRAAWALVLLAAAASAQTTWTGAAGTSWHVAGNWSAGVPTATTNAVIAVAANQPTTAGVPAVCQNLTVNAGATLTLAAGGGLTASGTTVTVNGAIAGVEPLTIGGGGTTTLGGTGAAPALIVAKTAGGACVFSGVWTLSGDFTLTSGAFTSTNPSTLNVGDDAVFSGGSLQANSGTTSIVDVADDVTFAGTTIPLGSACPLLRVGGDFVGAATFAPNALGAVVFDTGPSAISGVSVLPALTINAGVQVTVTSATVVNGALDVQGGGATLTCAAALDVNGAASVAAGGTWALGGLTHTVGASWTIGGAATGGVVRLDGATGSTWSGAGTTAALEVAKSAGFQTTVSGVVNVAGALTVTSGTFFVGASATVNVGDDAFFNGGVLQAASGTTSILDVADDVVFAGTTTPASQTVPTIRVGGDFTGSAAWTPTGAGAVVFDAGPSTMTGVCQVPDFVVNAGVQVVAAGPLTASGAVTVQGGGASLTSGAALDGNGAFTLQAGGTWNLGGFTHAIAGAPTFSGTIAGGGLVRFDGSATASWTGSAVLPAVEIAKTAPAQLTVTGTAAVTGDLTLTSGTLFINSGAVVNVGDDAFFNGGTLSGNNPSTSIVDVADDVTFAGAVAGFLTPTLRVGGDYAGAAAFAPTNGGPVVFDAGPSAVGGVCTFPELVVNAGVQTTFSVGATIVGPLTVQGGGATLVAGGPFDVDGAATVQAGGTWNLGGFTHTIAGAPTFTGGFAGGGVVRLDGGSGATWTGGGAVPALEIAKSAPTAQVTASGTVAVAGDLTLASGSLFLASNATVNVGDDAFFNGGVLSGNSPTTSILDVADDVAFAGTSAGFSAPVLRVGGDYAGAASYAPTNGGAVVFDAGPSTATGVCNFPDLTVNAGVQATLASGGVVAGALTVQGGGATLVAGAALDVNGAATVQAGGTWNFGGFTHTVAGNGTFSGTTTGGGVLRFDGAGASAWSGAGVLAAVEVAKSGVGAQLSTTGAIALLGDLTILSGTFFISSGSTVAVGDDVLATGGVLAGNNATSSVLDVADDVVFGGTAASVSTTPVIRVAGDFVGAASFAPTFGGAVIFDGGPSIASGACTFAALTIENGVSLSLSTGGTCVGAFLANPGSTTTLGGAFDVDGAATLSAGATLALGGNQFSVASTATFAGVVSGAGLMRADGSTTSTWSSAGPLPAWTIAKSSSTAFVNNSGAITVTGGLTLVEGSFSLTSGTTISVAGVLAMTGGVLSGGSTGVLDVGGDVVQTGGTAGLSSMPQIRCAGNWTGAASFAPSSGIVTLDGVGPRTVSGVAQFFDFTCATGVQATTAAPFTTAGSFTVQAGASFALTAAGQNLVVGADFTVAGSATMTGLLSVGDDLAILPGGSLVIGAGTHTIAGDLTQQGSFTGPGVLRFQGSAFAVISATAPVTNIEIAKTSSVNTAQISGAVSIAGALTLTSGTLTVPSASALSVSGSALLQGGVLGGGSTGVLDVEGDVTCAGTTASISTMPAIRCAGNWTGDAAFDPANGTVTLDGVGARSILGVANFFSLVVASGTAATTAAPFAVDGSFTVQAGGSFALTAAGQNLVVGEDFFVAGAATMTGLLAIGDDLTIDPTGALLIGAGVHTIAGDLLQQGAFTGPGVLRFIGASFASLAATAPLTNIEIAKTGGATVQASGSVTTAGNFSLSSGAFSLAGSANFLVTGDASMSGGTLSGSTAATLDVDGDVVFAGTVASISAMPHLRCGGDWTADANFAPTFSSVTLDGVGARTISGAPRFFDLVIASGTLATSADPLVIDGAATVQSGASLTLTTPGLGLATGGDLDVQGTATVPGVLAIGDDLIVGASGALTAGAGVHEIGSDLDVDGAFVAPGLLRASGAAFGTWSSTAPLSAVEIAKTGSTQLQTLGALAVAGTFTLQTGTFAPQGGSVVSVSGAATLAGGVLAGSTSGVLDCDAGLSITGATASNSSLCDLRVAGDYVAHAGFAPTFGEIVFDGAAPSTVRPALAGGVLTFFDVIIRNGVRTADVDTTWVANATTIEASGALRAAASVSWNALAPTVNGVLGVDAGGRLGLPPTLSLTIPAGGRLSLVGTPTARATLGNFGAAGYSVAIQGVIEAMNFRVESAGPNGLVITAGATIAPAPFDLRNGFFDNPFSPSSCLLQIERTTPTNLRYCVFERSNGVQGSNVRRLAGAAISLTNWAGSLAGESFDDDAGNLVTWNPPEASSLSFFAGIPGVAKASLLWTLFDVVDAGSFVLERSDAGGPFAVVHETAAAGNGPYAFVDDPLTPLVTYTYRLSERLTHGVLIELGTATVTPFTVPPPANILDVGPTAGVTTLQAAVNAAAASGGQITILRVLPGVFAPFTVSATPPGGLKILADGAGASIDTSAAPVVVQNLAFGNPVEIRGFTIGGAGGAQPGLVVQNCDAPVIVDDVVVTGGLGQPAVRVTDCPAGVSLTRLVATGTPGVRVEQASFAAISGTANTISLANGSYVQTCDVGAAVLTNDGSATREQYAGVMPRLDGPNFVSIGTPLVFDFAGTPLAYWALVGGFALDYVAYPQSILQMPQLLSLPTVFIQGEQFADGAGAGQYASILPPEPSLLGIPFSWQAVTLEFSGAYRLSNLATTVPVL